VLGEEERLAETLARVRAVFAERPEALAEIDSLVEQLGLPPQSPGDQPPQEPPPAQ